MFKMKGLFFKSAKKNHCRFENCDNYDCVKYQNFSNSFTFLFSLSILLELAHCLIPNRAFEFYDLFANSIGAVIAYLLINIFVKLKIK